MKQKSPNDSDSIRCKESTLVLQCEVLVEHSRVLIGGFPEKNFAYAKSV